MRSITKVFPGVVANDGVDLVVEKSSIHALVGENGAGKSTLMRILYGMYAPDAGQIFLDGKEVHISSPQVAIRLGIGMVHQEFQLVPSLSVADNIALGHELKKGLFVDSKKEQRDIRALVERFGFDLDLQKPISSLPVGAQQQVEIVKLLYRNAQVLILDEPTSLLTPLEVDRLFEVLRGLRDEGRTIIYITHKMREVKTICDTATVMRRGKVVGRVAVAEASEKELANLMVGEQVIDEVFPRSNHIGAKKLVLEQVTASGQSGVSPLRDLSLVVRSGEIVGVAGVQGNGQSEVVEAIAGLRRVSGRIEMNGKDMGHLSPRQRRDSGLALIPEKRNEQGLNLATDIVENAIATRYHRLPFSRWAVMLSRPAHQLAERIIKEFDVKAPGPKTPVKNLSGGNQQKVVIGREMVERPDVLIAAYPTRGLDVSATQFVRKMIVQRRDEGGAVLLISADLDEIFSVCDRIVVLFEGKIVADKKADETRFDEIGLYMTGYLHE